MKFPLTYLRLGNNFTDNHMFENHVFHVIALKGTDPVQITLPSVNENSNMKVKIIWKFMRRYFRFQ